MFRTNNCTVYRMSLSGEYRFECNDGLLILHPNLRHVRCFLENSNGTVPLFPRHNLESGQYLLPFGFSGSIEHIQNIVDTLSERILRNVSCICENKALLLKICFNVGRPAVELMEDCPALLSLIASRLDSNLPIREYTERATCLVGQKRKKILAQFSYPSSTSVMQLMRKIPPQDSGMRYLESFRKILLQGNPAKIKILRHAAHINWLVLHLVSGGYFDSRVRASFVLATGRLTAREKIYDVYQQIAEMDRIIDAANGELTVPALTNLKSLKTVHDLLVAQYMAVRDYSHILELEFPEPPLPGMEIANEGNVRYGIFPLKNGRELWKEGLQMQHCIATYAHKIVKENGWLYAYHVHLPNTRPATILIRSNPSRGKSRLEEMSGYRNSAVDPAVRFHVNQWLAGCAKKGGKQKGYTEEPLV